MLYTHNWNLGVCLLYVRKSHFIYIIGLTKVKYRITHISKTCKHMYKWYDFIPDSQQAISYSPFLISICLHKKVKYEWNYLIENVSIVWLQFQIQIFRFHFILVFIIFHVNFLSSHWLRSVCQFSLSHGRGW
jgi:hypothetical protein